MYYILFYTTVKDYIEKRVPYRKAHLGYAEEAYKRGELILAGALDNPADSAVLVFKEDSPKAVEEFVKNDPYVKNGIITKWEIRPWTVVIGG
jgi:uncharacterized protein